MSRMLSKSLRRASVSVLAMTAMAGGAMAQDVKTITIATHYNAESIAPVTECFALYEAENPGIRLEHQQASYADFLQTILTARVGGVSPDIYNIYSIWAPQLVRAGALAAPPQDVVDMVEEGYAPGTVGAATINGQLYGIPTELSVYQLVYNKKILEEVGYSEPPATWAELEEIAAAAVLTNEQGALTRAGYAFGPTIANMVHPFFALLYAAGGSPFNEDYTEADLTSPEAIEVLTGMANLYASGSASNSVVVGDFTAGAVAMAIMANWQKGGFRAALEDEFEATVGVAPIPTDGEPGTMLYSFFWAVDSSSDVQEEAWDFLKWVSTAQEGQDISCTGAMLQGLGALSGSTADTEAMGEELEDAFSAPYVEAVLSGAAVSQPNTIQQAEVERTLRTYIDEALAGNMTPTDALTAAQAEIQAILDDY